MDGTTDGSTLILTNKENFLDTGSKAAVLSSNISAHNGAVTAHLFDKDLSTKSDLENGGYHIIDFGAGVTVKLTQALILPRFDDTVTVTSRTNGMVIYGSNDAPVARADGTYDDSKVEWTALTVPVAGASWGTPNTPGSDRGGGSGMWSYMAPLDGISETGYRFFKIGGGQRGSAAEVEFYGTYSADISGVAQQLTSLPDQEAGAAKLNCPGIAADITVAVKSSEPAGIVAEDGTITPPLNDTKVKLVLTLTSNGSSDDTPEIEVTIKGLKSLLTAPANPSKGDEKLTLPTVPAGYTVSVSYSSNTSIIATGAGTITAPVEDMEVKVKLKLTSDSDSSKTVESDEFTVTVPGTGGVQKIEINSTLYNITASTNRNNTGGGTVKGMAELLFDGDTSTCGNLTGSGEHFYIIDFGPTKAVTPDSFQLYPREDQLGRLNGTKILGSNDYTNWTELTDAISGVNKAEWKNVALKTGVTIPERGYRYLKISCASNSYGNIGEVRVYGTVNAVEKQADLVTVTSDMISVSGTDSSSSENIIDGRWDTVADLTADKSAYYTIDFGEGKAITPTKFHLAPRGDATTEANSKEYLPALNGTTIYGSNNGSDWTALSNAVSDVKYGWNVLYVLDSVKSNSYRYLKVANAGGVALSEIEIYGTVGAGGTTEPDQPDQPDQPPEEEKSLDVSELAYNMTASSNRSDIGTAADVASRLFDGDEATFGNLSNASEYYYVIDFGVDKAVKPTKFSLYPRADQDGKFVERLNNTVISGSNNYTDWVEITDKVSGVNTAQVQWKEVTLKEDVTIPEEGYRYLKISGATNGNIGEVEVYGTVVDAENQEKPVTLAGFTITASAGKDSVTAEEMAMRITDGDFTTYGDMTGGRNAYFTIDFGDGKAITPTRFHLYPRSDDKESDKNKYRDRMNQTVIYGSNDGTNWTALTDAVSGTQYGWNVVTVKSGVASQSYRYLKISGADGGAIAEIEIY